MIRQNILIFGFRDCELLAIVYHVRPEALTGATIKMTVFMEVTPCKSVSHHNMLHQPSSALKMEALFSFKMLMIYRTIQRYILQAALLSQILSNPLISKPDLVRISFHTMKKVS